MLITLDISAAFDTIDIAILLDRLCCYFGVTGMPLKWIGSYLEQRKQYVRLNGVESAIVSLQAGVPQGSVLGPVLFSAFLAPLANVIDLFGISHHQYADDTSLYYSFYSCGEMIRPSMMLPLLSGMLRVVATGLSCVESVRSFGGPRLTLRVRRHASFGSRSTRWWAAGPLRNLRPSVRRTSINSSTPRWLGCVRPPPMPRRRRSRRSTPDAVSPNSRH